MGRYVSIHFPSIRMFEDVWENCMAKMKLFGKWKLNAYEIKRKQQEFCTFDGFTHCLPERKKEKMEKAISWS